MKTAICYQSHSAGAGRSGVFGIIFGIFALALVLTLLFLFLVPSPQADNLPVVITTSPATTSQTVVPPPEQPVAPTGKVTPMPYVIVPVPAPIPVSPPPKPKIELGDAPRMPMVQPQSTQSQGATNQ